MLGPSLEILVTAERRVSFGEDAVRVSDGALYALKEENALYPDVALIAFP